MTEYNNIKVNPETFQTLKEDKPEGVTWSRYLTQLKEESGA